MILKINLILLQLGLSLLVDTAAANAEPTGRWFYGHGKGVLELSGEIRFTGKALSLC